MSESFSFDNLFAGDYPKKTKPVTVLSGENVVKGQLMGKITASGKYRACNTGLSDGAEVCDGVMTADVDASAADAPGIVYLTGDFNRNGLTIAQSPSADTIAGHEAEMRLRSLFVSDSVSVLGTIS